jgi:heme/copper-type cytochrome/quinol oxidase subunit 4
MDQMTRQTETRDTKAESNTSKRIVGVIFAVVEVVLAFRLIFKGLGANPSNGFVRGIYGVTQFLVGIFEGIFSRGTATGAETTAVFEPATLIVMVVIGLIAWGVLRLMTPHTGIRVERTETTGHDVQGK